MQHAAEVFRPMQAQTIEKERVNKMPIGRLDHHGPPGFIMYSKLVNVVCVSLAMNREGDRA